MLDVREGYVRVDGGERSVVRRYLPETQADCYNAAGRAD